MDVRQTIISAAKAVGQTFVVESHQVQYCGVQIMHVDDVLNGVPAEIVGGSVNHPASNSGTRHPHRESKWMVLATVVAFGRRCPAELTTPKDQCVVE